MSRNGKTSTGELVIDLATLQLQPGDIMHIRAVARDRNNVTGPGESVSRTRIIRVARPEEMDQITTDIGVPPELPKDPVMSQRMIILMTERLIRERPRLSRQELQSRSGEIAQHQSRLREIVGEQVYIREADAAIQQGEQDFSYLEQGGTGGAPRRRGRAETTRRARRRRCWRRRTTATGIGSIEEFEHRHDESAILDVNRDLMRLHNLMWNSQQELNLAKPDTALPYQYEALKIIQQLNQAERTYPRGDVRVDPDQRGRGAGAGKDGGRGARGAHRPAPRWRRCCRCWRSWTACPPGWDASRARASSLEISNLAARVLGEPSADREAAGLHLPRRGRGGERAHRTRQGPAAPRPRAPGAPRRRRRPPAAVHGGSRRRRVLPPPGEDAVR